MTPAEQRFQFQVDTVATVQQVVGGENVRKFRVGERQAAAFTSTSGMLVEAAEAGKNGVVVKLVQTGDTDQQVALIAPSYYTNESGAVVVEDSDAGAKFPPQGEVTIFRKRPSSLR